MNKWKKMKAKTNRIAAAVFALSVVAMFICHGITQSMLMKLELDNFTSEIRCDTQENAIAAKNLLDGMVQGLEHTAETIKDYDDLWDPEVQKILALSQKINDFDAILISDLEGNAYTDTGYTFDVSDQRFFLRAVKGQVVFSEIMPSKRFKAIQIISFPLYSEKHELKAILYGLFDVETFSKLINDVVGYEERIYVIDSNGTYINSFDKNSIIPERTNFWEDLEYLGVESDSIDKIKKRFLDQKEGEFCYGYEGVQRYGFHMPLGIQDWQIVLTVEETAVNAHIELIQFVDTVETMINGALLIIMVICVYFSFKSVNNKIREANKKITKNNEMMRMAVEYSKHIIFEYDINTRQIDLKTKMKNKLFISNTIGPVPDCIIEKNIIAADSIAEMKRIFQTINTEKSCEADVQIVNSQQEKIWYRVAMHNLYNEKGDVVGTVGSAEDITMLKKGEEAIKRKEETRNILIKNAVLYARIDLNTDTVIELNGQEIQMSYHDQLYKKIIENTSEEHKSYVAKEFSLEALKEEYEKNQEMREIQCIMKRNQQAKWVACSVYRVHENDSALITLLILDIDKKKREEIELQRKAERDALTDLYNAGTTRSKISEILCKKHSFEEQQIFILLDLDNFKQINDTFGHAYGDQVLMDVAAVLNKRFRSSDIIGRLGGDEFVIFLCNVKSDYFMETMLNGLSEELIKTYTQGDISLTVSASIGVAVSPKDGMTLKELYEKADIQLYQWKKQRKIIKDQKEQQKRGDN